MHISTDISLRRGTGRGLKLTAMLLSACMAFFLVLLSNDDRKAFGASEEKEMRGVWVAYYDFEKTCSLNKKEFSNYIDMMFDNIVSWGMNAVFVHVRPFSDAMYKSSYFPWSYYASGKQGKSPGYDPLSIMVSKAHEKGLEIHAWINPYRVSGSWNPETGVKKLSKKNPARIWLTNKKKSDDRNVLSFGGGLYYNPSIKEVRTLIVNGVKEIAENYRVDGIHFDDYFYPELGEDYKTVFDAPEYEKYKSAKETKGKKYLSIADWRRGNVNTLIKEVYSVIKSVDPDIVFGISPGGYIDYLDDDDSGYADYRTWMQKDGYIDYICPQIYWSFNSKNIFPFYETLLKWIAASTNDNVRLYVGLPAYKMNSSNYVSSRYQTVDTEFYNQFLLADMVRYLRRSKSAQGFLVFDYADLIEEKNAQATENLKEEILSHLPEAEPKPETEPENEPEPKTEPDVVG